jgi:hypothetical protein
VHLEEELQELAVGKDSRAEHDLDGLGMRSVVAVGRLVDVASGVADSARDNPCRLPDQVLYAQKQPPARIAVSVFRSIVVSYQGWVGFLAFELTADVRSLPLRI